MAGIFAPSYLLPNGKDIDCTSQNIFSCQIQGAVVKAYQVKIIRNSDNAVLYNPAVVDISSNPLFSNDILYITIPATPTVGFSNGDNLKWTVRVWSNYSLNPSDYVDSSEAYFQARKNPIISINNFLTPITTKSFVFQGGYSQQQNIGIENYTFNLYDVSANLLKTSGKVFNSRLSWEADGLINNTYYYIEMIVVNQDETEVTTNLLSFYVSYASPSVSATPLCSINYNTNTILINWNLPDNTYGLTGWSLYRQKQGALTLDFVKKIDFNGTSITDALVGTNQSYKYVLFPETSSQIGGGLNSDYINVDFYNWSLTSIIPTAVDNQYTIGDVFLFDLDVNAGEIKSEVDVYEYPGFTKFDKISKGKRDIQKGKLTALMGYIDTNNNYVDTVNLRQQLQSVINNGEYKLLKSRKGDILLIQTMNFTYNPRSEIESQPLDISFEWQEVEDIEGISVTD